MSKGYSIEAAMDHLQRIQKMHTGRDWRLTIKKHNPGGLTAHQTTEVESIHAGFDWQAGQVVIYPAKPLTELSPEDVQAIHQSAKEGQSWHAYQADKRRIEQLSEALGVKCNTFAHALREVANLRAALTGKEAKQ